ncbi:uncharacterized protein A4U43_C06F9460 [Asparagus officinalis]|uniref:glutaredoxin-dependent peroxiredoxin n=1 Tax=Asparagus officinalis TaxID=4686 RepID=A0A5P1ERC3_ASPOF|nr:uncharacterized protein A4U43_C06F9460 [Asparagus officinalis]
MKKKITNFKQPPPPSPSTTGSSTPSYPTSAPPTTSRRSPSPISLRVRKPSSSLSPEPSPPTCSQKHLPGFVEKVADLKAKGVDTIAYVSVDDAFVIKAWKESLNVGADNILMLSEGNDYFTGALGVQLELNNKPVGLGVGSKRYALRGEVEEAGEVFDGGAEVVGYGVGEEVEEGEKGEDEESV